MIVTEKVIFTHDDRSVRPILLVDTVGQVFDFSDVRKIYIAMFNFQKMELAPEEIKKGKKVRPLKNQLELNLIFPPVTASYKTIQSQLRLVPSSELSYKIVSAMDEKLVKLTQRF